MTIRLRFLPLLLNLCVIQTALAEDLVFHVGGAVQKPGRFSLPKGRKLSVSQAILIAGGPSQGFRLTDCVLVRYQRDGSLEVQTVNLLAILQGDEPDLPIQHQDELFITWREIEPPGGAAVAQQPRQELPEPDYADVSYGPHERNVYDVWITDGESPTPLVIFYHGGGFWTGDKKLLPYKLLQQLLKHGMSVAAVNYRLSVTAPYPAQMQDCARALQHIRLHATDYNIDSARIGAMGNSAGAYISQWLAFHDDLADPDSSDPVLRQSTRLTAIAPLDAPTSLDPRFIKKLMELEKNPVSPTLFLLFSMGSAADADDPKFHPLFEEASPLNYLSPDDPPVLLYYNQRNEPLPPNPSPLIWVHHPKFGFALKEKADCLGVECTLLLREDHPKGYPVSKFVKFFAEKFDLEMEDQ